MLCGIYYIKLQHHFVCVCVCVCTPTFFPTRQSDRNQIWHTYSDRYGTDSHLKYLTHPKPRGVPGGVNIGVREGEGRTDGSEGQIGREGGRDVMAIMKWMHMAWNGCMIGNPRVVVVYS